MNNTVIKVESLSKQYRLGNVGLGSLGADINRWYQTSLRGREDPYLKIGEENDRSSKGESEYVWALRDINFEVKQGEVLGIIGRNGAGKSTLLKILSRTTAPTTGQIKIKGRVASLLEVGTGFHPELTGRENIFLNGAILGMTKNEIKSKFDEIVDFAGVERYIDTPVKRYSSGMYVRLAFAVAAHLEPEILIVDEVLAVGDIEFQKKALGKMKDVSAKDGRTVLFVSHNMAAVKSLCNRGILLSNGLIIKEGIINDVVDVYSNNTRSITNKPICFKSSDSRLSVHNISINESQNSRMEMNSTEIQYKIEGLISEPLKINVEGRLLDLEDYKLAFYSPGHEIAHTKLFPKGNFVLTGVIKLPNYMNRGEYRLVIGLADPGNEYFGEIEEPITLTFEGVKTATGLVFEANKSGWLFLSSK